MFLIVLIVKLISECLSVEVDLAPLEDELSIDTFEFLNMTKEYMKFNISDFDELHKDLRRKADHISWYTYGRGHFLDAGATATLCYTTAMTYENSYESIRKYYHIRFLYVNNVQYEVGYIIYEIIHKYQMMLELYQMIVKKFFYAQDRHIAPISYMLYVYSNILEYSMMVIHLCNMLHEVESKYAAQTHKSVFDNYIFQRSTRSRGIRKRNFTKPVYEVEQQEYQVRVEVEKKKRRKELRKKREKAIISGTWEFTTVTRRPKKSMWPLEYGWSIEYW